ncbi:MAG: SpoIIE family protein phosphatase [Crocinitomicaceae bacterium]
MNIFLHCMTMNIKQLWHKISFLGLRDDQEFSHREVILLNKLVFVGCILYIPLIPVDYIMNESKLLAYQLIMFTLCMITLLFSYLKWFNIAKFYFYFVVISFICFLGIGVGEGTGNDLTLFAVLIAPAMLFKDLRIIIFLSVFTIVIMIGLRFAQASIEPFMDISLEDRRNFQLIFQLIVSIIIFFQVYYFKNINFRFQDLLSSKNDEIAEKNKEIVDSINYAQRIQDAYLPPKEVLGHYFPESFLFFETKDIVSGDFYWFYGIRNKEGQLLDDVFVVAADCTGHGVPGAIMSVICCNALNEVVVKGEEYDTGKILDKVREQIVTILKTKGNNSRKDGMDVAMVRVNRKSKAVQFSGANNPLWILKNGGTEIEEIKADKQPVGAYENAVPFTAHSVTLSEGDQLYMFSDGIQDQFGGEKGKKLKAANLKKIILDNKTLPLAEQQSAVKKAFHQWKGDLEQVDDVVMIGLRL